MNRSRKKKLGLFVFPILAILTFSLTRLFMKYPHLAEIYYSQRIYPTIAAALSGISKRTWISIDDLFYTLLLLMGIILIILLVIRQIKLKNAFYIALNSLAAIYTLFHLLWGFNYYRPDIYSRLNLETHAANREEFIKVFNHLINDANDSYVSFENFDYYEGSSLIETSYRELAVPLKLRYPSGSRKPKEITLSNFFAQAGISGYFGPFFNEVHINRNLLPVEYPFVLAHEKAHQFGITGEAEANFIAWLVCKKSESNHLKYSAYIIALRYFMYYGYRLEGYKEAISRIDIKVIEDIRKINAHWNTLRHKKIETVASKVNDAYLRTNQVEKGVDDYTGIVKYIMDFSLDSLFQEEAGFQE